MRPNTACDTVQDVIVWVCGLRRGCLFCHISFSSRLCAVFRTVRPEDGSRTPSSAAGLQGLDLVGRRCPDRPGLFPRIRNDAIRFRPSWIRIPSDHPNLRPFTIQRGDPLPSYISAHRFQSQFRIVGKHSAEAVNQVKCAVFCFPADLFSKEVV